VNPFPIWSFYTLRCVPVNVFPLHLPDTVPPRCAVVGSPELALEERFYATQVNVPLTVQQILDEEIAQKLA